DGKEKTIAVVIEELEEEDISVNTQEKEKGPRLGMSLSENSREYAQRYNLSDSRGLVVTGVMSGSPAALAGIQPGDILLELDRKSIKSMSDFKERISKYKKGDTLLFLVKRQSGTIFLTLNIE
ncbi:MAG: PDZ domain-containing protein, partial [Deltaproteobacteria bacterium]|nr:PDZ domain-containing protein [Deltaproteobacteria bacterium]